MARVTGWILVVVLMAAVLEAKLSADEATYGGGNDFSALRPKRSLRYWPMRSSQSTRGDGFFDVPLTPSGRLHNFIFRLLQ